MKACQAESTHTHNGLEIRNESHKNKPKAANTPYKIYTWGFNYQAQEKANFYSYFLLFFIRS